MIRILKTPNHNRVGLVSVSLALSLLASVLTPAQGAGQKKTKDEEENPVFNDYRGVQIGMTADDARKKLGRPERQGRHGRLFCV